LGHVVTEQIISIERDFTVLFGKPSLVAKESSWMSVLVALGVCMTPACTDSEKLYERIENGEILNAPCRRIGGYDIPPLLLGDAAYPLSKWLMKPYPENALLGQAECTYNTYHCKARVKVEQAFGELGVVGAASISD